jgi:predicted CXXCH cytochrome family protein
VHSPKSAERQLVQPTETQVCATCHRLQVTKTERAVAHMPVREGKMSCSSCHNPHGSISNVKNLKTGSSVAELCTSCHTEMRGPMLFEHAPVRENCATCHDPHGSSNDRMLVVRMPMLCQRCHIASKHPATLYDKDQITTNKSNRMFGRSCVNCHSNRPRLESSVRPVLHAVTGDTNMRRLSSIADPCRLRRAAPQRALPRRGRRARTPPDPAARRARRRTWQPLRDRPGQLHRRRVPASTATGALSALPGLRDGLLFSGFATRSRLPTALPSRRARNNVGWRDQEYFADYNRAGKLR